MEQRLTVHEPPTGLVPGVLEGVWAGADGLPTMSPSELIWYFVSGGLRTITSVPISSIIAIATIALCVFLLGGVLFGVRNVDQFIREVGTSLDITAYVKDSVSIADVEKFAKGLTANEHVESVRVLNKEEALQSFKEELGPRSSFVEALEGENPLPASIEIRLKTEHFNQSALDDLLGYLRAQPQINEVVYGSIWVEKARGILSLFRIIGTGVLCVVISVLVFLITNTIKLVIYAREDELAIMQLVGASDNFVNIPFALGGALQGLFGAFIGVALLDAGWLLLNQQLRNSSLFGVALPQFSFLPFALVFAVIMFGMAIGALGSYFAIRKFLHV